MIRSVRFTHGQEITLVIHTVNVRMLTIDASMFTLCNSMLLTENGGEEESQGMEDGDDQGLASSEEKQNGDKPSNGLAAPVAEVQVHTTTW